MAICHLNVKTVSRCQEGPAGSTVSCSAVAAAAYRSGRCMHDERRGVDEDYSHRHGVVRGIGGVELPEHAPEAYRDPEVLWNAVEAAERSDVAALYTEFVAALPVELYSEIYGDLHRDAIVPVAGEAERIERAYADLADVARTFARSLADQGMCAHWELHDPDREQRNPHAHIMCTTRSIGEDGEWLAKSRKQYLMRDPDGRLKDRYVFPEERRRLEERGWAPVYRYDTGAGKPVRLTAAQAAERGLGNAERVDRHPVSRKETTNDWGNRSQVAVWRQRWEETVNAKLAERGHERDAISASSYEDQGIARIPTLHEGSYVRSLEEDAAYIAQMEGREYIPVTDVGTRNLMAKEVNERIEALERDPIPNIEIAADPLWLKPSWQQRAIVAQLMEQGRRAMSEPIHPNGREGRAAEDEQLDRASAIERNRGRLDEIQRRADLARELSRGALERAREHAEAMERQAERERAEEAARLERAERAEERVALSGSLDVSRARMADREASRAAEALGRLRAEVALGEEGAARDCRSLDDAGRRADGARAALERELRAYEDARLRVDSAPLSADGAREAERAAARAGEALSRAELRGAELLRAEEARDALARSEAGARGDRAGYERLCEEQLAHREHALEQALGRADRAWREVGPDSRCARDSVAEGCLRLRTRAEVDEYEMALKRLEQAEQHLGRHRADGCWERETYDNHHGADWDEVDRLREVADDKSLRRDEAYGAYAAAKRPLEERPVDREGLARCEAALAQTALLREVVLQREAAADDAWLALDRSDHLNALRSELDWEFYPRASADVRQEALDRAVMECDRMGALLEERWRDMGEAAREQARSLRDLDRDPVEPVSRDEGYWERAAEIARGDRAAEVVRLCAEDRPLDRDQLERLDDAVARMGDDELDRVREALGWDNARLERAVERTEGEYRRGAPVIDPNTVPRELAGILASASGGGDSGYERPAQRRRRPDRDDDDEGWHYERGPRMGR